MEEQEKEQVKGERTTMRESNSKPNDIILHVNLHDQDAKIQQETIGILGTNLLHACFYQSDPKVLVKNLLFLLLELMLI